MNYLRRGVLLAVSLTLVGCASQSAGLILSYVGEERFWPDIEDIERIFVDDFGMYCRETKPQNRACSRDGSVEDLRFVNFGHREGMISVSFAYEDVFIVGLQEPQFSERYLNQLDKVLQLLGTLGQAEVSFDKFPTSILKPSVVVPLEEFNVDMLR